MTEPAYVKTIICLANSRKTTGRCIAGKEVPGGGGIGPWVRPVSARPTGEISEEERRYEDGKDPRLLDVVRIPMIRSEPHGFQSENHVIDSGYYWRRIRAASAAEIEASIDPVAHLWPSDSSYNGINDRVTEQELAAVNDSLRLIKVTDLEIRVAVEGAEFGNGRRKVRGHFSYNGRQYLLAVTDPLVERTYLAGNNGSFVVGAATLCVSLGELYNGHAYKLIAAVVQ